MNAWTWTNSTIDSAPASIQVTAGPQTISLWMREGGIRVDRLLFTKNATYVPSGSGPSESAPSCGSPATSTPTQTPTPTGTPVVTNYLYDLNGNLEKEITAGASPTTITYSYDYENRLNLVQFPDSTSVTYFYNYAGELLRTKNNSGSAVTFVYGQGTAPLVHKTSSETRNFVQVGGKNIFYQRTSTTYRFLHQDALGSVVAMTKENHDVQATTTYDPYGKVINSSGTATEFKFVGGYGVRDLDLGAGKYMMGVRAYDSTIGRFTSQDPLGFAAGDENFYRYARNNPLRWIDPKGLKCEDCPGGFWTGVGSTVGGFLVSGGIFTSIYKLTCVSNGKSCWFMTECAGMGIGLGGGITADSYWTGNAGSISDITGRSSWGTVSGGVGVIGTGGSFSGPPATAVYGAGIGLGGGYALGSCKTSLLWCTN